MLTFLVIGLDDIAMDHGLGGLDGFARIRSVRIRLTRPIRGQFTWQHRFRTLPHLERGAIAILGEAVPRRLSANCRKPLLPEKMVEAI